MRRARRRLAVAIAACLAAAVSGCSSGDTTTGTDGGDEDAASGRYLLEGWFGGTVVEGGFGLWVGRIDPDDPSAKECVVTINGTGLDLMELLSTDDDALYAVLNYDYEPGTEYTITATLGSRSATCSFTGPDYPWITITSPQGDTFVPGTPSSLNGSMTEPD